MQSINSQTLAENLLEFKDYKLILSVSGGVDSMTLLHVLLTIVKPKQLLCVYFDHGKRADTQEDIKVIENFLEQYPQAAHEFLLVKVDYKHEFALKDRHKLSILTKYLEVAKSSKSDSALEKNNFMAAASNFRFNYLQDLRLKREFNWICLAQHSCDIVENFLMASFRGAGTHGLAAMSFVDRDLCLVRPLVDYSKKQIIAYAKQNSILWHEDSSNPTLDYDRNFLRNSLLPQISERFESARQGILQASRVQASVSADYNSEIANFLQTHSDTITLSQVPCLMKIKKAKLSQLAGSVRDYLWYSIFASLPSKFHREFKSFLENAKSGSQIYFNGVYVYKTPDYLYLSFFNAAKLSQLFSLQLYKSLDLDYFRPSQNLYYNAKELSYKQLHRRLATPFFLRASLAKGQDSQQKSCLLEQALVVDELKKKFF
ncbi:tRNA lysidine(34) synthetase TilS [bacterium]|jgi:tRNA(Ile)-lysidine synthetase-like protein|nr:tRNA lysidine(34) synthetase TilS [bacterium]